MKIIVIGIIMVVAMFGMSTLWEQHLEEKYNISRIETTKAATPTQSDDAILTEEEKLTAERLPEEERNEYISMARERKLYQSLSAEVEIRIRELSTQKPYFDQLDEQANQIIQNAQEPTLNGIKND